MLIKELLIDQSLYPILNQVIMESNFLEGSFDIKRLFHCRDLLNGSDPFSQYDQWSDISGFELHKEQVNLPLTQKEPVININKRRRKRKQKDEATIIRIKTERAERNRRSAKASRERTHLYIKALEREVLTLRQQVAIDQYYLKLFALDEKHKNPFAREFASIIPTINEAMATSNQPFTNAEFFTETFKRCYQQKLEAKRRALERLTKEMVEMITPFSVRLMMWLAEKNTDCFDAQELAKSISSEISFNQVKEITEYFKCIFPYKKKYEDVKVQVKKINEHLKVIVKDLIECQKRLQIEMKTIENFITTVIFPDLGPKAIEAFSKLSPKLATKPEFSNFALHDLTSASFTIEEKPEVIERKKPPFIIHAN